MVKEAVFRNSSDELLRLAPLAGLTVIIK